MLFFKNILSRCWGVRLPRHIWDVENSRVRISPFRPTPKMIEKIRRTSEQQASLEDINNHDWEIKKMREPLRHGKIDNPVMSTATKR